MADAQQELKTKSLQRTLVDKAIKYIVSAGGLTVLITLILILVYLLLTVLPLFTSPKLSFSAKFPISTTQKSLTAGINVSENLLYQISENGSFSYFSLDSTQKKQSQLTLTNKKIISSFFPSEKPNLLIFGLGTGEVIFQELIVEKQNELSSSKRKLNIHTLSQIQIANTAIDNLCFSSNQTKAYLCALTQNELYLGQWHNNEWVQIGKLNIKPNTKALIDSASQTLYLLSDLTLLVYQFNHNELVLRESIDIQNEPASKIERMSLLANGMLLLKSADGAINLWMNKNINNEPKLSFLKQYTQISDALAVESNRSVFTYLRDGYLYFWHVPSNVEDKIKFALNEKINHISFSPQADKLIVETENELLIYDVDNPHPEINLRSLLKKIWYQGEEEADFIWQTASGKVEAKISLIPLLFGTIKTVVFTLFFATPIAIGGAIYTAYFMPKKLRAFVKPTVELMAAFPTVILGFIASIWLAPWLESHFLQALLYLVFAPIVFFIFALVWGQFTKQRQLFFSSGEQILLLIVLNLILALVTYFFGSWIESNFYQGYGQAFITQTLGLDLSLRNTIVIGIVMGFAVIPVIFTIAEDAIFSVPRHLTYGSLALGATHWQTLVYVVLATASPGIISALLIGISRAVGETMIVLMATGNTPITDWNPFVGLRSLTANIAVEMPESVLNSSHFRLLFLTAFLLFCFTFLLNTFAEFVRYKLREKYRSL